MDYEEVSQSLLKCVTEIALDDEVDLHSRLLKDDIIDSFAMLAILTHIEVDLNVEIDPEDISSDQFDSIDKLTRWVLKWVGESP